MTYHSSRGQSGRHSTPRILHLSPFLFYLVVVGSFALAWGALRSFWGLGIPATAAVLTAPFVILLWYRDETH